MWRDPTISPWVVSTRPGKSLPYALVINLIFRWLHPQMMIITRYCWQFLEFPPHHVEGGGNLGSNLEPNWIVWSAHEWGDWSVRTKVKHSQHRHHFHQPHFGIRWIVDRIAFKFSLSSKIIIIESILCKDCLGINMAKMWRSLPGINRNQRILFCWT